MNTTVTSGKSLNESILSGAFTGSAQVDFETYRKAPYVNWSLLRVLREKSPMHAKYERDNPLEKTPAMLFGEQAHCLILEENLFRERYAEAPQVDKRTIAGKAEWARCEAANPGKTLIRADEYDRLVKMASRVRGTKLGKLLTNGEAELSLFWVDAITGLKCKARLDYYRSDGIVVDLKTCISASAKDFGKTVYFESYHCQLAFYLSGLQALKMPAKAAINLAIEKEPPHGIAAYHLQDPALSLGQKTFQEALEVYSQCLSSGEWPGYAEKIQTIEIPEYAYGKE